MTATQTHFELLFAPASTLLTGHGGICAKVDELRVNAINSTNAVSGILLAIIIILLVLVLLLLHGGMRLMV